MSIFEGDMVRAVETEHAGTGFRMNTNIKARPGSQGTLFQGGKPVAQHRWPRGYSPMRMAQVATVTPNMTVAAHPDAGDPEYPGISHPHLNPASESHTRRLMREPIARSTYGLHDLAGISGGIHLRVTPSTPTGEFAHYNPTTRAVNVNRQSFGTGDPRQEIAKADTVLMHEIGHHVDISARAHEYNEMAGVHSMGFEGLRGSLEHNADKNMIEHFRNDPRNQRKTGLDIRKQTYGGRGVAAMAGHGYEDPGTSRGDVRDEISRARAAFHSTRTGGVATPSVLHPGQFDTQGALF